VRGKNNCFHESSGPSFRFRKVALRRRSVPESGAH
jgi:hypothetical protein